MTDSVGNLTLPAGTADSPPGDPILNVLLAFFKQCIVNNVGPAWTAIEPNVPVVKTTDARDPTDDALTTTELPALYLTRDTTGPVIWFAQDWRLIPSTLTLRWVLPPLQLKWRRQRSNIINAASTGMQMPLEQWGRAPGLVFPGDTDPAAATKGSLLFSFAKFHQLRLGKCSLGKMRIGVDATAKFFDCITWQLTMIERLKPDLAADYLALAGVSGNVQTSGLTIDGMQTGLTLAAIVPATGTVAGGTTFTIQGAGIAPNATISIGGTVILPANLTISPDGATVDGTAPAGTVGAASVVVTNPGVTPETAKLGWTYT